MIELTDPEVAVLIDSLVFTRDHIRDLQGEPTNIVSALDKIKSLMTPATIGLRIEGIVANDGEVEVGDRVKLTTGMYKDKPRPGTVINTTPKARYVVVQWDDGGETQVPREYLSRA